MVRDSRQYAPGLFVTGRCPGRLTASSVTISAPQLTEYEISYLGMTGDLNSARCPSQSRGLGWHEGQSSA